MDFYFQDDRSIAMKPSQRRKPTHMDKIYELQHLNGHFTRLWNEKSTIDNKTPRSFYLNPRSMPVA